MKIKSLNWRENKKCIDLWVQPRTVFERHSNSYKQPILVPKCKKYQNLVKIHVSIKGNIKNNCCSAIWVDLKMFLNHTLPLNSPLLPSTSTWTQNMTHKSKPILFKVLITFFLLAIRELSRVSLVVVVVVVMLVGILCTLCPSVKEKQHNDAYKTRLW